MRSIRSVLIAVALLAIAVAPAHANWSIGANLGMNILMPDDDAFDNVTTFGWPLSSNILVPSASPGLRVGFGNADSPHEFYALTDLHIFNIDPLSLSMVIATANYQYNVPSAGNTGFFLTGGAGLMMVRADDGSPGGDVSGTGGIFGGGGGVRHKMGNGHGVLRAEVRYDLQTEGEDGGAIVIPKGGNLGVRLGFDLWD